MSKQVHKSWPSINQFRQVVREVKSRATFKGLDDNGAPTFDPFAPMPTLTFEGSVKAHGTNASVACEFPKYNEFWAQSRERILTIDDDNYGWAKYAQQHKETFINLLTSAAHHKVDYNLTHYSIFGEWCGQGVQKGVGISNVPKMFIIFGIVAWSAGKNEDEDVQRVYFTPTEFKHTIAYAKEIAGFNTEAWPENLFTIYDFQTYTMDINFNEPELAQNKLADLTVAVEQQCPIAQHFGVEGVGEGIVWKCVTPGYEQSRFMFKVKGEKHSSSKVKTLASVDVEKVNSINEFADTVVTESRLTQGLEYLKVNNISIEPKSTPVFLKWIADDVVKEETDTLVASHLEIKDVITRVKYVARTWFLAQEEM
jgi:hypothetical protein